MRNIFDFLEDATSRAHRIALAIARAQADMVALMVELNEFRAENAGPIEIPLPGLSAAAQSEGAANQGEDQAPQNPVGPLPLGQGASEEARSSQFVTVPEDGEGAEVLEAPEPFSGPDQPFSRSPAEIAASINKAAADFHETVEEFAVQAKEAFTPGPGEEWTIQNGNVLCKVDYSGPPIPVTQEELDQSKAEFPDDPVEPSVQPPGSWVDEQFPEGPVTKLTDLPTDAIADRVLPPLTAAQSVLYRELPAKLMGQVLQVIRRDRKARLNGAEVAAHLGFQRGTLYNYERGGSKVGPERLALMLEFYGLTLEDFFDRVTAMLPTEDDAHRALAAHEAPLFTFDELQRIITTNVGSIQIPTAAWAMILSMRNGRTARTNDLVGIGGFRSTAGAKVTLTRARSLLRYVGLKLTQPGGDSYRIEV